jgi:hypothetical protein
MPLRKTAPAAVMLAALLAACGGGGSASGGSVGPTRYSEVEPNGNLAQANPISLDAVVAGTVTAIDDLDFYQLTVPAGGASVRFQTFDSTGATCDPVNLGVDPMLAVYDSAGTLLTGADDNGLAPSCEDLTVALPAGTAYVMVVGYEPFPFAYTLRVTRP